MDNDTSGKAHDGKGALLDMQAFFPYRLAVFAETVSRTMAGLYADRFQLTRQEWRILAALANMPQATATVLGEYSTLDKMQVSRALADMEARGLVARAEGRADRRTKEVRLTAQGRALFRQIVPLVQAREEALLSALSLEERVLFCAMMDRLEARARGLQAATSG